MSRVLRVLRGDISQRCVDAIATPANRHLSGNASPNHWRFVGRKNADGAIRIAGGKAFEALLASHSLHTSLKPGEALVTPAAGDLCCSFVIHAVAPDGLYGAGHPDPSSAQLLLRKTYASVIEAAARAGARSLACPAIGAGVQGHHPAAAAREAFAAGAEWLDGELAPRSCLSLVELVCFADDVWSAWPVCAVKALKRPPDTNEEDIIEWHSKLCRNNVMSDELEMCAKNEGSQSTVISVMRFF